MLRPRAHFRLLGPPEVWVGDRLVDIGAPKRRAVLAALLLDAGSALTVETLIDRVWDQQPPGKARDVLYAHVSRIRHILATLADTTGDPMALERRSGGYLVRVDPELIDLHRFRSLADQARRPERSDADRVRTLREALALWRGDPLAGLPGEWMARKREGLRRQRLDIVLAWARMELSLGRQELVIDALYPLVAEHPTVEPLSALLMRALHAAGRGADALSCYAITQRHLSAELGVDPGPELRTLHQAILRGAPARSQDGDDADQPEPGTSPAGEVPAQLPPDVRGFAGRVEQLTRLDRLRSSARDRPATCTTIAVVTGMPGVGKTTLVLHWAHRVATAFPDGQLYVNLRGFGPGDTPVSTAQALRGFLEALHVPAHRIPASLEAQIGMYRSLLADRRMLIILDNARDVDQVRPLLPGSMRCMVVVTSRDGLAGLVATEGARPMRLDPMSAEEGRQLLVERLGSYRVDVEAEAAEEIVRDCARLPLALSVVAARAATHPAFPLAVLAKELREARGGLDGFEAGDATADVRSVFSWSYRLLSADAAMMFRLLALHPGPDTGTLAAASLAGVPIRRARAMLRELTRAHLLVEHTPGRFTCHDLLRVYAVELVHTEEWDTERRAATHRLLDHYLHTAHAGASVLHSVRDPIEISAPQAGVSPEPIADHDHALAWFTDEHGPLMAAIQLALRDDFHVHAWQLPWSVHTFLDYRGHWDDQVTVHTAAVAGAGRLADLPAQAYALLNLGAAHGRLGQYDNAHLQFQRSLELYQKLGRHSNQARTHLNLGRLSCLQSHFADAVEHARRAQALYSADGNRAGLAVATNSLGWYYIQLGDHVRAIQVCTEALALHEEVDDRNGLAATWDSLGVANEKLDDHAQATRCYRNALEVLSELGDRYNEANVLVHLGESYRTAARHDAAAAAWHEALAILDDLGHSDADGLREKLAGLSVPSS
ncbi:SARP family transcriptional regulator [Dactylosporangium sucinum]|uniref:SARP family transcriptional regulator n=1 Tax=Dactylosporangium sucinum TaxID=1424081 RepID=A0A917TZ83_9ACTN|nr:SARP family transcriptional regulator [Dactylosporangium sucinum]